MDLLLQKVREKQAPIVVGLDPTISMIPSFVLEEKYLEFGETFEAVAEAFYQFNTTIIDAVYDLVPAVKPQVAMYEALGIPGLITYKKTIDYAKAKGLFVIGDVKRGDIGSTSKAYADGHLGVTKVGASIQRGFNTDSITVNPYLGTDGIQPFLDVCNEENKSIFILVKTSNPSSGEFQDQLVENTPLYEIVGKKVREWGDLCMGNTYSNVGAVVGATYPEMGKKLRDIMPNTYILVPGYGAQGGKAKDLQHFFHKNGEGAIINSSRGIIAAYQLDQYKEFGEENFGLASRQAVKDMKDDILQVIL